MACSACKAAAARNCGRHSHFCRFHEDVAETISDLRADPLLASSAIKPKPCWSRLIACSPRDLPFDAKHSSQLILPSAHAHPAHSGSARWCGTPAVPEETGAVRGHRTRQSSRRRIASQLTLICSIAPPSRSKVCLLPLLRRFLGVRVRARAVFCSASGCQLASALAISACEREGDCSRRLFRRERADPLIGTDP